jgi:putative oxidoreductase
MSLRSRLAAVDASFWPLANPLALLGRVLLSAFFLNEGYDKIINYGDTISYMEGFGVSARLLPLVILLEISGGLAVLSGFLARPAAIALAGYCLLTAFFFHRDFADADQYIHFQKNVTMAGGFLILAAFGPGAWSLDALIAGGRPRGPRQSG